MAAILIVDDNTYIRTLLREILEMDGHHISEATNGEEALQAVHKTTPDLDLMIVDMQLPGMLGNEVIQKIRDEEIPMKILAISGGSSIEDMDSLDPADQQGATRNLKKPFEIHVLRNTVQEVLNTKI